MPPRAAIRLPDVPTLAVGVTRAIWVTADGEVEELDRREAARRVQAGAQPLLCHAPAAARRLGIDPFPALDLLELFAFVRPATFCVPTPRGLADALDLDPPESLADAASALRRVATRLLTELKEDAAARGARLTAQAMAGGGWAWGEAVLDVLGTVPDDRMRAPTTGLDVWRDIAGMERARPASATRQRNGEPRRGAAPAGGPARPCLRTAAEPGGLCLRRDRGLPAARCGGRAALRAGGSRHRRRQDARLPRARQRLGGEERRAGLGLHLHPQPAAPDRPGARPAVPGAGDQGQPRRRAQGPGELSLPPEHGRSRARRRPCAAGTPSRSA